MSRTAGVKKTIVRLTQKSLSHYVIAGRMRLLQYYGPMKVTSESRTRGTASSIFSFSWFFRGLTKSENAVQRRLNPNVVKRSILVSNIGGDSFGTRSAKPQGSNIRRLKQFRCLPLPEEFSGSTKSCGPKRDAPKASSRWPVRFNLRTPISSQPIHFN
jgi:hypothetical protein